MDLSHPLVQSLLLPMGASFTFGLLFSRAPNIRITGAAIGIGLIMAILTIVGMPVWPPLSGLQKLIWLIACAVILGVLIDTASLSRWPRNTLMTALTLSATVWLAWPAWQQRSPSGKPDSEFVVVALTLIAGLLIMSRLLKSRGPGASQITMLIIAAVALAVASFNAGSLALAQMSGALASACAGFALLIWPGARLELGLGGRFAAAFACFVLVLLTLLLTDIHPIALLPILAVFTLAWLVSKLPMPVGWSRLTIEPLLIASLGAGLVVLAFVFAPQSTTENAESVDDPYYTPSSSLRYDTTS